MSEGKIKVNCAFCGKEKEIWRWQYRDSKHKRFFCNNSCGSHYQYGTQPKPPPKCRVCGRDKHGKNGICELQYFVDTRNLQRMGFDISKIGTEEVFTEWDLLKERLSTLYLVEEKSIPDLIKMFNMTSLNTIHNIFKSLGIKCRNFSECTKNSFKHGKLKPPSGLRIPKKDISSYKFAHGWHTTWEGNKVFYRSSYELDYMKELDNAKIPYQGENYLKIEYFDSQLNKKRTAFPDFYLPESNTIVEIKSVWTYNAQNMIDKVKAYRELGYNFKLILEHNEIDI